jgi:PAS domain-containing protein
MSSDSRDGTPGTLIVEVPHWAATVRVFDNSYRQIAVPGAPSDDGQGRFRITLDLVPGVYRVEASLGGTDDSEWVSVRGGKRTTVPAERWSTLQLVSAAPLSVTAADRSKGPDLHAQNATRWSQSVTWTAPVPGTARLFIYIQTPDPVKYPGFSQGLKLLDKGGNPLTDLDGASVRSNIAEGWSAFTTDLVEDCYILARFGPGETVYHLPLYPCNHWETHVFMAGGRGPSFRSLTTNMAPFGHGFRYDDDTVAASEAVLSGMRREHGTPGILANAHLKVLLRREQKNPWLAVLAAYALTEAEADARLRNPDEATAHLVDPALREDVLQFLRRTIGSHPDVRALSLDANKPSPEPFEFPPLTRIGLQRVRQHSTKFADTIPVGSLTDTMLSSQVTTSPWTVWVKPAVSTAAADAPLVKSVRRRSLTKSKVAPTAAPMGSAVAPMAAASGQTLRQVVYNLPLINAAQELMSASDDTTPDKIAVKPKEEATKLLAEIDPSAFSAAAGIPLGRAEQVLHTLRNEHQGDLGKVASDPTERAILEYAVRKGANRGRTEQGASSPFEAPLTSSLQKQRGPTLEEAVVALRDAAEQLLALPADPDRDPSIETTSKTLAGRLRSLAEQMLRYADLVAITDTRGEFLYGNGAFMLLMSLVDQKDPLRACRKWSRWLSQLPPGRSSQRSPGGKSSDRRWTIRRVPVEDQETGKTTAFVNLSDDERTPQLPETVFDAVVSTASEVTLHTSFVQYASPKRRAASLDHLERIASRLEQQLSLQGEKV